jgi:CspA family cold shock protein
LIGTIKYWNGRFGFIVIKEANEDVFFHATNLEDDNYFPRVGDILSFEVEKTEKGLNAINVKLIEGEK